MARLIFGFLVALGLAMVVQAGGAEAQVVCGPHREMVGFFDQAFGEKPVAIALTDFGALLEVLVSPQGSWTIILTRAGGPSCVVATGQNWQTLATQGQPSS
jgi:hypothetical protein